jgi:micrococcal nuclease
MKALVFVPVVLLLGGCALAQVPREERTPSASATGTPSPHASGTHTGRVGTVAWVDDGDTVDVSFGGGRRERVRLIGINAPEDNPERVECHGKDATSALRKRLPLGTRVVLVRDRGQDRRDRYGRLLGYLQSGDTDINRWLVGQGHAQVYVYMHRPFERYDSYSLAQSRAQRLNLGLWQC